MPTCGSTTALQTEIRKVPQPVSRLVATLNPDVVDVVSIDVLAEPLLSVVVLVGVVVAVPVVRSASLAVVVAAVVASDENSLAVVVRFARHAVVVAAVASVEDLPVPVVRRLLLATVAIVMLERLYAGVVHCVSWAAVVAVAASAGILTASRGQCLVAAVAMCLRHCLTLGKRVSKHRSTTRPAP